MTSDLITSPLDDRHRALDAKFAAFGGWSMPLEYSGAGVVAEHTAVRTAVGIFDVSHLGKVTVAGHQAIDFVNRCLTNDLTAIGPGQAQYTLLCTPSGGVADDMIAYLKSADEVFLIPNAANTSGVATVLSEAAPDGVTVTDQHQDFAVLAVQGPHADETLQAAGLPTEGDYMSFHRASLDEVSLTVCRTGYTGERGFELVCPSEHAGTVWDAVMAAGERHGIQPAGLGARDTLRTEMVYPLHGQDVGPDISPLQARLNFAIGWEKETFIGAEALRAQKAAGAGRNRRPLRARGRGIPRPGMTVRAGDAEVGHVTSGTFSPTLKTGIAMALVDPAFKIGDVVTIDIRGREAEFEIIKPPFVQSSVR